MYVRVGQRRLRVTRRDLVLALPPLVIAAVAVAAMLGIALNGQRAWINRTQWMLSQTGTPRPEGRLSFTRHVVPMITEERLPARVWRYLGHAGLAHLELMLHPGADPGGLPTVLLDLEGDGLRDLLSALPLSGRREQRATIQLGGRRFDAAARLRGDGPGHWLHEKKSWRVKLRRGESLEGRYRRLNLIAPKSTSMLQNPMAYWLAGRLGLQAPDCRLVNVVLNGSHVGVHQLTEQIDEYFLRARQLPRGELFYGELLAISWTRAERWDRHVPQLGGQPAGPPAGVRRLQDLLDALDPGRALEQAVAVLPSVLDLDDYIDWTVLDQVCATEQNTNYHNQRLYHDPVADRLRHLVWDYYGHVLAERPLTMPRTPLADVFQRVPVWVHENHRRLLRAIDGPASVRAQTEHLARTTAVLRGAVVHDVHRARWAPVCSWQHRDGYLVAEWEDSIEELRRFIVERDAHLRGWLGDARLRARLLEPPVAGGPWQLELDCDGHAGTRWTTLTLASDGAGEEVRILADLDLDGRLDADDPEVAAARLEPARTRVGVDQLLLPGRRRRPLTAAQQSGLQRVVEAVGAGDLAGARRIAAEAEVPHDRFPVAALRELLDAQDWMRFTGYEPAPLRYRYWLIAPPGRRLRLVSATAHNDLTGDAIEVAIASGAEAAPGDVRSLHPWRLPAPAAGAPREERWAGERHLAEDVVVPRGTRLWIEPGTRVSLAPGRTLRIEGALEAVGTDDRPITFTGGAVVASRATVRLERCTFAAAGPLTLSHCRGEVRWCLFTGGSGTALDVQGCSPLLRDCVILDAARGITCRDGAGPLIHNSYLGRCGTGVVASADAIPVVLHCVLAANETAFATEAGGDAGRPGWIEVHNSVIAGAGRVESTAGGGRVTTARSHRLPGGADSAWLEVDGSRYRAAPDRSGERTCRGHVAGRLLGEDVPERVPAGLLSGFEVGGPR